MELEAFDCPNCEGSERWYWRKHRFIKAQALAHGADVEAAFAVYAVLSTNSTVAENDRNYLKWLRGEKIGHFGSVLARIALADIGDLRGALAFKKGRKIVSFHENLRFPWRLNGAVTIDRHAAAIVLGDRRLAKNMLARKDGYESLAFIYRKWATLSRVRPHEMQARTWVHHVECNKREVAA